MTDKVGFTQFSVVGLASILAFEWPWGWGRACFDKNIFSLSYANYA